MSAVSIRAVAVEDICMDDIGCAVLLKKAGKFGLAYRLLPHDGLIVTGILPDSAVADWNAECDPDDMICVGDRVLAINKKSEQDGLHALVGELKNAQETITVDFLRAGPRWHIDEQARRKMSTSRSMDRTVSCLLTDEVLQRPLGPRDFAVLLLAVALPNIVLLALFSDIGVGLQVYSALAPARFNFMGNATICCGCGLGALLYIFDWQLWEGRLAKVGSVIAITYILFAGATMKVRYQPYAPLVICLFHLPIIIGILRLGPLNQVKRRQFYLGTSIGTVLVVLLILVVWMLWMNAAVFEGTHRYNDATKEDLVSRSWRMYKEHVVTVAGTDRSLNYLWDCKWKRAYDFLIINGTMVEDRARGRLIAAEKTQRATSCSMVKTTWFLTWTAPLIGLTVDGIISIFCFMNGMFLQRHSSSHLDKVLKTFVLLVACMLLGMWISASIAGASLRLTTTLMAFFASGIVALSLWLYFEIGRKELTLKLQRSKMMLSIMSLATSDWLRALLFLLVGVLLPPVFATDMLRQRMRKLRGLSDSDSLFTSGMASVMEDVGHWNVVSVLSKANWLVILFWTVLIGGGKVTVVFLSWLNEALLRVEFELVAAIFFAVGYVMFLLPPVPGIPVYICSGIVIAARTRSRDDIGFWGGTIIAVLLSFVLKLSAVCGQYMFGYCLGKSTKVQQLVGVDKVFIRSIEKILKTDGLNLPKVSVLVGGPDWPTSVLCGILRLNVFQCVLGTMPVILVSTPCVLAGAFMSGGEIPSDSGEASDQEEGMRSTMAATMLGVSALCQMASGMLALYYIQDVVSMSSQQLSRPRPEHQQVAELTRREQRYVEAYASVTNWGKLGGAQKGWILASCAAMLVAFFIFLFMDEACFRNFEVRNSIGASEALNGLDGNVFNLVQLMGWGANCLFLMGCLGHGTFLHTMSIHATASMKQACPCV